MTMHALKTDKTEINKGRSLTLVSFDGADPSLVRLLLLDNDSRDGYHR